MDNPSNKTSENTPNNTQDNALGNTPKVTRTKSFSPVWLVPIAALMIALILGYQAWRDKGPVIEIAFNKAEGIEPNRTKIRYKDVVVGTVKAVRVSNDLNSVIATAELAPEFSEHLSVNTQFWIVAPRISLSGISGLGTLLSGVFIELDIGEKGEESRRFNGLEEAPRVLSSIEGASFILFAHTLGSIDVGSPVYHKQIKVGEVTSYSLNIDNGLIEIRVFVESPFDKLVQTNSRFWNVSGVEVDLTANGISAHIESLSALIGGGIAFNSFSENSVGSVNSEITTFYLSPSYKSVTDANFADIFKYQLDFTDQSVRGLAIDAPVEYAGIVIGRVTSIRLRRGEDDTFVSVNIEIYPSKFGFPRGVEPSEFRAFLERMFKRGFKAQLKNASLITGSLIVDFVKTEQTDPDFSFNGQRPKIPTIASSVEQITQQITSISDKINRLPIDEIGTNLNNSLSELNRLISQLNNGGFSKKVNATASNVAVASNKLDALLGNVKKSLGSVNDVLNTMENTIAPDSEIYYELLQTIQSIGESADSVKTFTDELNRHPQSLILGKEAR